MNWNIIHQKSIISTVNIKLFERLVRTISTEGAEKFIRKRVSRVQQDLSFVFLFVVAFIFFLTSFFSSFPSLSPWYSVVHARLLHRSLHVQVGHSKSTLNRRGHLHFMYFYADVVYNKSYWVNLPLGRVLPSVH